MRYKFIQTALLCAVTVLGTVCTASANSWPERPIRLVVPFAPGGSADVAARIIAEGLGTRLNQPIVIDNKSGASGNIGADFVAKSAPDGYTLLLAANSVHVLNPSLFKSMPFDGTDDFDPVGNLTNILHVLIVKPTLPVSNIQELISLAKNESDGLTYGSAGTGSIPHLAAELFQKQTNVNILHVPFRGGAPANVALLSGTIDMMFTAYANVRDHIAAGKVRLLGTTEPQRVQALPDVPAINEVVPGYSATGYYGILAPKGTPEAIRMRVFNEVEQVLATPAVIERLEALGLLPDPIPPQEFKNKLIDDRAEWSQLIRTIGIEPN
ncbi:tripartite tricarboxylate transporter substrate binding protein [Allopusillimonas soli]|uniref:Tripartite tricarboxylate transporter substrate binding protein n=1 Tax=Allopusillimonas soli TaxID=659016 RepID=A0A853F9H4_9BURK|nr:tripartite tricarboxylate transporter substrate binding protein [Allopusillimonas soli]NYT35580.1 tripartite tricarboxylate transporter substrate binding protein [Allopusillimonas soli]TEA75983.1 tripartite tricarboxylate transporter substrate binding protein [Allopusillimonas soli]